MMTRTRNKVKPVAPVKTTRVLFDGGERARPAAIFGRGIEAEYATRWSGCYGAMPFDESDNLWLLGLLGGKTAAEVEAEEDAYNEWIDHAAFEDACLQRYTRGYAG